MSQQQTVQSVIKDFQKRLREDMSALRENFKAIIEAAKCEEKLQLSKTTAAIYDKCQIQSKLFFLQDFMVLKTFKFMNLPLEYFSSCCEYCQSR